MAKQPDLSFQFGVFSSCAVIWIYLYGQIVDLTTQDPVNASLLYLGFAHYVSFLCCVFSFITLLSQLFKLSLGTIEYNKLIRFRALATYCQKILFLTWGPMFIFSITSLFTVNIFYSSTHKFLQEGGGFLVGGILSIIFFWLILRINIWRMAGMVKVWHVFTYFLIGPVYCLSLSNYAADVVFTLEKPFYKEGEIERFQLKRKGYIFLPQIITVDHNFADTLSESFETTYEINPKILSDTTSQLSGVEVIYRPQFIPIDQRRYFYIPQTKD